MSSFRKVPAAKRQGFKNLRATYTRPGSNFAAAYNVITQCNRVWLHCSTRVDRVNPIICAGTRCTGGFNGVGEWKSIRTRDGQLRAVE
jgi:hypothetical protein